MIGALMIFEFGFGLGFGRSWTGSEPPIDQPQPEEPSTFDEPIESASEPGDFISMSQIGEAISAAYAEHPSSVAV